MVKHKVGNFYFHDGSEISILAQVKRDWICLIRLDDGNRWEEPVFVMNIKNISDPEWDKITTNQAKEFHLATKEEIAAWIK